MNARVAPFTQQVHDTTVDTTITLLMGGPYAQNNRFLKEAIAKLVQQNEMIAELARLLVQEGYQKEQRRHLLSLVKTTRTELKVVIEAVKKKLDANHNIAILKPLYAKLQELDKELAKLQTQLTALNTLHHNTVKQFNQSLLATEQLLQHDFKGASSSEQLMSEMSQLLVDTHQTEEFNIIAEESIFGEVEPVVNYVEVMQETNLDKSGYDELEKEFVNTHEKPLVARGPASNDFVSKAERFAQPERTSSAPEPKLKPRKDLLLDLLFGHFNEKREQYQGFNNLYSQDKAPEFRLVFEYTFSNLSLSRQSNRIHTEIKSLSRMVSDIEDSKANIKNILNSLGVELSSSYTNSSSNRMTLAPQPNKSSKKNDNLSNEDYDNTLASRIRS